jgi:hypothetical protein
MSENNNSNNSNHSNHPLLSALIHASVGNPTNFRMALFGQAVIGFLYSFGYFDLRLVGLVIGYVMPVIWVVSTYRLLKVKAMEYEALPYPLWMKKEPGNSLVIILDIVFLSLIWLFILSGLYTATWIKVVFTLVFPLLTLAMLRSLYNYPPEETPNEN